MSSVFAWEDAVNEPEKSFEEFSDRCLEPDADPMFGSFGFSDSTSGHISSLPFASSDLSSNPPSSSVGMFDFQSDPFMQSTILPPPSFISSSSMYALPPPSMPNHPLSMTSTAPPPFASFHLPEGMQVVQPSVDIRQTSEEAVSSNSTSSGRQTRFSTGAGHKKRKLEGSDPTVINAAATAAMLGVTVATSSGSDSESVGSTSVSSTGRRCSNGGTGSSSSSKAHWSDEDAGVPTTTVKDEDWDGEFDFEDEEDEDEFTRAQRQLLQAKPEEDDFDDIFEELASGNAASASSSALQCRRMENPTFRALQDLAARSHTMDAAEVKRLRRKLNNRLAAQASRERKQNRLKQLEEHIRLLEADRQRLKGANRRLAARVRDLERRLQRIHGGGSNGGSSGSTGVAMAAKDSNSATFAKDMAQRAGHAGMSFTHIQPAPGFGDKVNLDLSQSHGTVAAGVHITSAHQPLERSLRAVASNASSSSSSATVLPVYVLPSHMSVPRDLLVPVRVVPTNQQLSASSNAAAVSSSSSSSSSSRYADSPVPSESGHHLSSISSSSSMKDSPPRSPSLISVASTTSPLATSSTPSSMASPGGLPQQNWSLDSLSLPSSAVSSNPLRAQSGSFGLPRSGMFLAVVFAFAFLFQLFGLYDPSSSSSSSSTSLATTTTLDFSSQPVVASSPRFASRVLLSTEDSDVTTSSSSSSDLPVVLFEDMSSSSVSSETATSSSSPSSSPAEALVAALHLLLLQPDVALAQVKAHAQAEQRLIASLAKLSPQQTARTIAILTALSSISGTPASAPSSSTSSSPQRSHTSALVPLHSAYSSSTASAHSAAVGGAAGTSASFAQHHQQHQHQHSLPLWTEFGLHVLQQQMQQHWIPLLQQSLLLSPKAASAFVFSSNSNDSSSSHGNHSSSSNSTSMDSSCDQTVGLDASSSLMYLFCPHAMPFQIAPDSASVSDSVASSAALGARLLRSAMGKALPGPAAATATTTTTSSSEILSRRLKAQSVTAGSSRQQPQQRVHPSKMTLNGDGNHVEDDAALLHLLLPTHSVQSLLDHWAAQQQQQQHQNGSASSTTEAAPKVMSNGLVALHDQRVRSSAGASSSSSSSSTSPHASGSSSASTSSSASSATSSSSSSSSSTSSSMLGGVSEVTCRVTSVRQLLLP